MARPDDVTGTPVWAGYRAIIHVDLDAFYASVEQQRRPELRGKPVIVGGGAGPDGRAVAARGVVSAASYEARRHGVRSAMPLTQALRLCPHAQLVPVDFTAYRAASAVVFEVVRTVTDLVEPLSLDEAYLDVTGSQVRFGTPQAIAESLRQQILERTGLHASFGIGTCKTIAKIASDREKPRGFVVVPPGREREFLAPLQVREMPGLGPASERALLGLGVTTLGQLAALPVEVVRRRLGAHAGQALWERAQGIDTAAVTVPGRPKSVSREETFLRDIADRGLVEREVRSMAADVARRLREGGWRGRTVTLKLRTADYVTTQRQHSLAAPLDADRPLGDAALRLLNEGWGGAPLRLVGVGVSILEEGVQLDLLDPAVERQASLDRALDGLRKRYGAAAVHRGEAVPLRELDFRGDDLRSLAGGPALERRGAAEADAASGQDGVPPNGATPEQRGSRSHRPAAPGQPASPSDTV